MGGRDILHSMLMLVPAGWQGDPPTPAEVKDFYEYHQTLNEPWDGPAALSSATAAPSAPASTATACVPPATRSPTTGSSRLGSEVGLLTIDDAKVIEKGRLGPGEMIAIDTVKGELLRNNEIKATYAKKKPYGTWLRENIKDIVSKPSLESQPSPGATLLAAATRRRLYRGGTQRRALHSQDHGRDRRGSHRLDGRRHAAGRLSKKPRLLYTYFKQLFAQVTNPPIDPIREKLVMSVEVLAGAHRNWLEETPEHARLLRLQSPILTNPEIQQILALKDGPFHSDHDHLPVPHQRGTGRPEETSRPNLRGSRESRR